MRDHWRSTRALLFTIPLLLVLAIVSCEDDAPFGPNVSQPDDVAVEPTGPTGPGSGFVLASAGDLIANVNLPIPGFGVSVAANCTGDIFYTLFGESNLYVMDKEGALIATLPVRDVAGAPVFIDEMAWDDTRGMLWGVEHGSNPEDVYLIDPTTGDATFQWQSATVSVGSFRDGIAFDGTDGTVWITGDVSTTIEHYQDDGTPLATITPKNASGGTLGLVSGVTVGVGDLLYLGQNGAVQIVQVKKSNGDFLASFASPGGARDEGLECDAFSFAPKLALWSREFNSPGFVSAIEVEAGTCVCGGGGGLRVEIDIKPNSDPNSINPKSMGLVPVAILGSAFFDVTDVDVTTLAFGPDGALPVHDPVGHYEDVNGDGFIDLVSHYRQKETGLAVGNTEGCITGETLGGTPFEGCDAVRVLDK